MAAALEPLRERESAVRSTLPKVPVKPKRKPLSKTPKATVTEASAAQVTQAKKQQSTIDLTATTVSNELGVLTTTQSPGKTSSDIEVVSAVIARTNTIDIGGAIEAGGRGTDNSLAQSIISESSLSSTGAEMNERKKAQVQTTTEPHESSKPVEQKNEPLPKLSLKRKAAAEPVSSEPAGLSSSSTIAEDNSPPPLLRKKLKTSLASTSTLATPDNPPVRATVPAPVLSTSMPDSIFTTAATPAPRARTKSHNLPPRELPPRKWRGKNTKRHPNTVLSSLNNIELAAKKRKAAAVKEETTEEPRQKCMKLSVRPAAPVAAVKETEPAVKA
ncbi:hypothetical protein LTR95_014341 [Oleoguttula sp. CCFEE 5521]